MATLPYTEEELRARIRTLEEGLLQVAKGVTFADRGVQYHEAAELQERIAYFRGLLGQLSTVTTRPRQFHGVGSKGF